MFGASMLAPHTPESVWAKGGLKERCQPHTVVAVRAAESYGDASELSGPAISIACNKQTNKSFNRVKPRFLFGFFCKSMYIKSRINVPFRYFSVVLPTDF